MSSDFVSPIYKLATETLLAILEFASFHTTWNEFERRDVQVIDRWTLRSISLVSTEWRQISAQFHLRILTLDPTSPETPKLLRRFRFDPSLAKYVRSVTISRDNEGSDGGTISGGGQCPTCYGGEWTSTYERDDPSFTWRKVLTWASQLPNLKHLHISHVSGEGEGDDESAWLAETIERESWATFPVRAGAFSSVTTFYASVQIDLSMVWWILKGMERLEWLFLQSGSGSNSVDAGGAGPSTAVPSLPDRYLHLKHLQVEECEITRDQFLKLISTATSLTSLKLACLSTPHLNLDDVALVVERCPELKSLSWTNGKGSAENLVRVIESSHLAHLDVRPWPTDDVDLVRALPPSLETLALIEDSQISALVVMATIDSLAPELLSEIFGHLVIGWERSHLCVASLVCRRWRDPAQRVLFQNVDGGHEWCSSAHTEGLTSLSITYPESVTAVGACAIPTLQSLIFTNFQMSEAIIAELLRIIKLPNLEGVRRLEIPMVSKDELAGEAGLALLDECEERSISLLCRYGYLTRDMMEEASPSQD
ncbi:hypothetical protein RQP46_010571 [Phenoliferia psychrophenolica]